MKKIIKLSLIYFSFLFDISVAKAERSEIRLNQRSLVSDINRIPFYDLIDTSGVVYDSKKDLYSLIIEKDSFKETESQNSGLEIVVSAYEVLAQVRRKLSALQWSQFSFVSPEKITIKQQRNFVSENRILHKIEERLSQVCSSCEVKVENLRLPTLNSQTEVLATNLDVTGLQKAGSFLIPYFVETSQKKETYWITGVAHFFAKAAVLKRSIKQNERISENDFEIKKVFLGTASDGVLTADEIIGRSLKTELKAGSIVSASNLKKEYDILKGDQIKVLAGSGEIEITSLGVADTSAFVGDSIKVKLSDKNANGSSLVNGKVIGKGMVRVE